MAQESSSDEEEDSEEEEDAEEGDSKEDNEPSKEAPAVATGFETAHVPASLVAATAKHDLTCLELAKKIWGSEVIDSTIAEIDSTVSSDGFEKSFLVPAIAELGDSLDEETVKERWNLATVQEKRKIEETWKLFKEYDVKRL
ncbi:hypothetical protein CARUB_v10015497mg [Capsella rubella]|uniref:Glabrous enhancer-binding protein-like C-terminal domain-containing protein n=1 Tax=Capsella rubella TaxID=81985 RepID=R0I713_9BRAS|nr:hypothetical protein CARUB_v10015497mg [Capsella rubella]